MPFDQMAEELFQIMDPEKHRPPHPEMNKMMQGEMAVMRLLGDSQESLMAGEISRRLNMTTSRISAVLASLEKKGMIRRSPDPMDRRRVAVYLTQEGCQFNSAKRSEILLQMRQMLMQLGEEDARAYIRLTKRAFELMHGPEGGIS